MPTVVSGNRPYSMLGVVASFNINCLYLVPGLCHRLRLPAGTRPNLKYAAPRGNDGKSTAQLF